MGYVHVSYYKLLKDVDIFGFEKKAGSILMSTSNSKPLDNSLGFPISNIEIVYWFYGEDVGNFNPKEQYDTSALLHYPTLTQSVVESRKDYFEFVASYEHFTPFYDGVNQPGAVDLIKWNDGETWSRESDDKPWDKKIMQ